jgi:seryl-tRNA synthetase
LYLARFDNCFCLLLVLSLADRAQARVGLLWEAANAHAEVAAAREATLQAQIEAAQDIQHVKETMARQAQKEVAALRKKLEVVKQKAKDATADLQAVMEGKLPRSHQVDSVYFVSSCCSVFRP